MSIDLDSSISHSIVGQACEFHETAFGEHKLQAVVKQIPSRTIVLSVDRNY